MLFPLIFATTLDAIIISNLQLRELRYRGKDIIILLIEQRH
jgi:hypothetical protein